MCIRDRYQRRVHGEDERQREHSLQPHTDSRLSPSRPDEVQPASRELSQDQQLLLLDQIQDRGPTSAMIHPDISRGSQSSQVPREMSNIISYNSRSMLQPLPDTISNILLPFWRNDLICTMTSMQSYFSSQPGKYLWPNRQE
eukprot:TRINITY_DN9119_c0_g1_i3.p1 TRINITY_DN9119_c0_g1~~TRINITY_DN9119_c0_g1_i3.p1  ORF type:complete len:142 (+),score=13.81 TRINITY_DN9119_c0_g1_i3:63-488(+)